MAFSTKSLTSWDELQQYVRHGWLYRGQRETSWKLRTSLERFCERSKIVSSRRADVEFRLCREFRRGYHQYGLHVPKKESSLEWLALMQHHGAPTRLLDFTYSIFVAAYFAVESSDGDSVVWGVNGPWALQQSVDLLTKAGNSAAGALGDMWEEGGDLVFRDILFNDENGVVPCAFPVNPFRLNERLRIQMGVFMTPSCVSASFEDNLQALPGREHDANVLKVIIPADFRGEAVRRLFEMGLSRRSLFPGLDGYAQSLAVYTPALDPIPWRSALLDNKQHSG